MKSPAITVIVPAYQAERTVERAITSVQDQDYTAWECIVVDDGSSDGTFDILNDLAASDSRITVLRQKNAGRCIARNAGIAAAHGEWVLFLDSDDYLRPGALSCLISQAYPEVIGVWGECDLPTGRKLSLGAEKRYSADQLTEFILNQEKYRTRAEFGEASGTVLRSVWGKLYRSSRIKDRDIAFAPGLRFGEDVLFNLSYLACGGEVAMLHKAVYFYDTVESSTCRSYSRQDGKCLMAFVEELCSLKKDGLLTSALDDGACVSKIIGAEAASVLRNAAMSNLTACEAARSLQEAFSDPRIIGSIRENVATSIAGKLLRLLRIHMVEHGKVREYLMVEKAVLTLKRKMLSVAGRLIAKPM